MTLADVVDVLACPVCGELDVPLAEVATTLRCEHGHAFDIAKQGYVNLYGRPEPRHADRAPMVAARERFLASGAYDPIAAALAPAVRTNLDGQVRTVVEAGAGSAWYLARVLADLAPDPVRGVALDISVPAARSAARVRGVALGAVVADVWGRLPLLAGSADVVLSVFAPRHAAEFARVLRPGAVLVVVSPLPDHLLALRELVGLLDVEPQKQERLAHVMAGHLEPVAATDVRFDRTVDHETAEDLVAMGPNAFHQAGKGLDELGPVVELRVAVQVGVWRRAG